NDLFYSSNHALARRRQVIGVEAHPLHLAPKHGNDRVGAGGATIDGELVQRLEKRSREAKGEGEGFGHRSSSSTVCVAKQLLFVAFSPPTMRSQRNVGAPFRQRQHASSHAFHRAKSALNLRYYLVVSVHNNRVFTFFYVEHAVY